MALLYCAGWDFLPTDGSDQDDRFSQMGYYDLPDGPYPPAIKSINPGRFGYGQAIAFEGHPNGYGHVKRFFPDTTPRSEVYMGCAMYGTDFANATFLPYLEFSYNTSTIIKMQLNDLGVVKVYIGETLALTTNGGQYYNSAWNYWEMGCLVANDTSGWITIRLNTVPIIALVDTVTGTQAPNGFGFGQDNDLPPGSIGLENVPHWDDLYVTDTAGSQNVGFLGNVRVQALLPDGDSGVQEFSVEPGSNANWESASNVAIDNTEYVYSGVTNAQDKYTLSALDNAPIILGVQVSGAYRQDDATQRSVATVIDSNGTESEGGEYFTPQSNFTFKVDIWETDPDTTVAWLYTAVNGLIVGPKVKS